MEQYKTCPDCNQAKPINDFHNNRKTKDGKATYCKVCLLARGQRYRLANPEKVKASNKASKARNYEKSKVTTKKWRQDNRERYLELKRNSYHRHLDSNRAKSRENYRKDPAPYKARAVEWAKRNPEKKREMVKLWFEKNPGLAAFYQHSRRLKLKENQIFEIRASFIRRLYQSACIYCGSKTRIEADHVIPVSRGGRHSEGNLVPACMSCNRSKHDEFVMEWKLKR